MKYIFCILILSSQFSRAQNGGCKKSLCDSTHLNDLYYFEDDDSFCSWSGLCLNNYDELREIYYYGSDYSKQMVGYLGKDLTTLLIESESNLDVNSGDLSLPNIQWLNLQSKKGINIQGKIIGADSLKYIMIGCKKIKASLGKSIGYIPSLRYLAIQSYRRANFSSISTKYANGTEIFVSSPNLFSRKNMKTLGKINDAHIILHFYKRPRKTIRYLSNVKNVSCVGRFDKKWKPIIEKYLPEVDFDYRTDGMQNQEAVKKDQ